MTKHQSETFGQMLYNSIIKGWKCALWNCKISDEDMYKIKNSKLIYHFYCKRCGGSILACIDKNPDRIKFVSTEQYTFDEWWETYLLQQPNNTEDYIK